jgi:hypothetical protein
MMNTLTAPYTKGRGFRKPGNILKSQTIQQEAGSRALPECVNSFSSLFGAVCDSVPQSDLLIDSITIRGSRAIVRYRREGGLTKTAAGISRASVQSMSVLRLDNGSVEEHLNNIYQVRR